jgi:hypothetical protein
MNKLALIAALGTVGVSSAALAQKTPDPTAPSNDKAMEQPAPKTDAAPAPAAKDPAAKAPAANDPAASPAPSDSAAVTAGDSVLLTDAEAKAWIDKVIFSSDGKNVGEVAAFARDSKGNISEMHADVGGFLGLGETRVRILPSEFKLAKDRVVLNFAADKIKTLPHLEK